MNNEKGDTQNHGLLSMGDSYISCSTFLPHFSFRISHLNLRLYLAAPKKEVLWNTTE